eukprot:Opistho-2@59687
MTWFSWSTRPSVKLALISRSVRRCSVSWGGLWSSMPVLDLILQAGSRVPACKAPAGSALRRALATQAPADQAQAGQQQGIALRLGHRGHGRDGGHAGVGEVGEDAVHAQLQIGLDLLLAAGVAEDAGVIAEGPGVDEQAALTHVLCVDT